MTAIDVLNIYNLLNGNGISIWVDGGWGVDALLGKQSREHEDLDIAVHRKDNASLRQLLVTKRYREKWRDDSSEFMYVMENRCGNSIDMHVFEYGDDGINTYGIEYPFGSLAGTGVINGQKVNCINPQFMLRFKTGYEPKENDLHDVRELCKKFNFALPSGYGP
jgi:lincosamide nucleotidyltransferase A/C/D/E